MNILNLTLQQFLEFSIYSIPGVILWYFLFRFQNRKSLPVETVRDMFFIGILSIIPLLLYQYVYETWLPQISTDYFIGALSSSNIVASIAEIILGFIILGIFFVIIISGFTIFYSLFTKESFKNVFRSLISEPMNLSATSIIFLIVLVLDIVLRSVSPFHIPKELITTTFILAMLEEYSKHLFVRLFDDHKIKNVSNAIELSIIVALSFAFLENIIYFTNNGTENLHSIVIGRSIVSMFGHITFSSIFGYYYGISKFAKSVMHVESVETHAPAFPQWVYKIFRFNTGNTYKAQKIFEGLVFATLVHTVFNILLELGIIFGIIPILIAGGYIIFKMLNSDISQREFSLVGSREMPEEDFEKLVWKISTMKHLQTIKKEHPDKEKNDEKKTSMKRTLVKPKNRVEKPEEKKDKKINKTIHSHDSNKTRKIKYEPQKPHTISTDENNKTYSKEENKWEEEWEKKEKNKNEEKSE